MAVAIREKVVKRSPADEMAPPRIPSIITDANLGGDVSYMLFSGWQAGWIGATGNYLPRRPHHATPLRTSGPGPPTIAEIEYRTYPDHQNDRQRPNFHEL